MSAYGRLFATLYDPFLWWSERRGMADQRRELLAGARGRVLEIGAGTGLNVACYRDQVTELVLAEPEQSMLGRLDRRRRERGLPGSVVAAGAESLPVRDASFDTVVSTLVLCTVPDPGRALEEIARVLAPGGRLLFLEHVQAEPGSRLAPWQDRLHDPWHAFAYGCHCNRDTLALIETKGFTVDHLERGTWRGMPAIVHPLIVGSATAPAGTA